MAFDAGSIYSELKLDRSPFIASLQAARQAAWNFARQRFEATLGANVNPAFAAVRSTRASLTSFARERYEATLGAVSQEFDRNIGRVQRQGVEFARRRYEATVGANTTPARRTLSGFDEVMRRYSRSWGQQGIRARVLADITRAQVSLRLLDRQLDSITDPEHRIRVEAEVLRTQQRLQGLNQLANSLGVQSPTISVGLRGYASTAAQMLGLTRLADRIDGYNATIGARANIDRSLSSALPNLLGALELQVMRYRSVLMAVAAIHMPIFLASLAAVPGAAAVAGGAVGSLAISVGKGLVGAFGAGAVAAGLGGAALGAYGIAVMRTWKYVGNFTDTLYQQYRAVDAAGKVAEELKLSLEALPPGMITAEEKARALAIANSNVAQEQEKMVTMIQIMTPRLARLNDKVFKAEMGMTRYGGSIMHEVAPALSTLLSTLDRFAPGFSAASREMTRDMTGVTQSIIRAASRGQNLKSITTVLQGVKSAGVPALRIVGNTALFAVNMIAPMVPAGLDVLDVLERLTTQGRLWSQSAEGQRRWGEIWGDLWSRGKRLVGVAVDLGAGLWGVGRALDQTGVGDMLFRKIEQGADSFRRLMRYGGEGRDAIVEFGRDSKPVLNALISLGGEGWRQLMRLVGAVSDTNKEGKKFGTFLDVIKSVEDSLKPITDLLIHEFKVIGPLIPPLIKNLAEWFGVMGRATPEMKFFIKFLGNALEAFNSLPDSTQRNIARILAYGSAIKALGGGAALSGLATLTASVLQWRKLNQILRTMPKTPPVVPPVAGPAPGPFVPGGRGNPLPAPTVPAPVPAKGFWSTFWTRAKGLASPKGLAMLAGRISIVVGVAMVAEALWNPVMKQGENLGKKLGTDKIGPAIGRGLKTWMGAKNYNIWGQIFSADLASFKGWKSIWDALVQGFKGEQKQRKKDFEDAGGGIWGGIVLGFKDALRANPFTAPFLVIYEGMKRWWGIKSPSEKAKTGVGKPIAQGILAGFKSVPILGGLITILERLFTGAKKKRDGQKWQGIGRDAIGAVLQGLKAVPIIGPTLALLGRWFSQSKNKRDGQKWYSIGSGSIDAIVKGWKSGGLLGAAVALIGSWYTRSKSKREGQKWFGLGSGAVGAITQGWKNGGLLGAAVALIGSWFARSKGKRDSQKWSPLGSSAAGAIASGWKNGGLLGAAVSLVASWFGRSKAEKDRNKWSPLGSSAASAIASGWKNGGLLGAAASLIASWFTRSKQKRDSQKWQPMGSSASSAIASGWKNGGLLGAAVALISSWFGRSQGEKNAKPWGGIGSGAAGAIAVGWKNSGLVGAAAGLIASWYQSAKSATGNQGWWGIGKSAVEGIGRGIGDNKGMLGRAITAVSKLLPDWAKKALGISSPSKVFREQIGRSVGEGFALGIEDKAARVRRAAETVAREAAAAASGAYAPELRLPDLRHASRPGTLELPGGTLSPAARAPRVTDHRGGGGGTASPRDHTGVANGSASGSLDRLIASSEKIEALMGALISATDEVGPAVRESFQHDIRNGRETRRSMLSGLSREQRRYGWVRGLIR